MIYLPARIVPLTCEAHECHKIAVTTVQGVNLCKRDAKACESALRAV